MKNKKLFLLKTLIFMAVVTTMAACSLGSQAPGAHETRTASTEAAKKAGVVTYSTEEPTSTPGLTPTLQTAIATKVLTPTLTSTPTQTPTVTLTPTPIGQGAGTVTSTPQTNMGQWSRPAISDGYTLIQDYLDHGSQEVVGAFIAGWDGIDGVVGNEFDPAIGNVRGAMATYLGSLASQPQGYRAKLEALALALGMPLPTPIPTSTLTPTLTVSSVLTTTSLSPNVSACVSEIWKMWDLNKRWKEGDPAIKKGSPLGNELENLLKKYPGSTDDVAGYCNQWVIGVRPGNADGYASDDACEYAKGNLNDAFGMFYTTDVNADLTQAAHNFVEEGNYLLDSCEIEFEEPANLGVCKDHLSVVQSAPGFFATSKESAIDNMKVSADSFKRDCIDLK